MMNITILQSKASKEARSWKDYVVLNSPKVLEKLNSIVDWENSIFPEKENSKEEDREILGTPPVLKPGDTFYYGGNIIACVNNDTISLVISESGGLSLKRIYEEVIETEYSLLTTDYMTENIDIIASEVPEGFVSAPIPYNLYKIVVDRITENNGFIDVHAIQLTVESPVYLFPVSVYISCDNEKFYYDPEILDDESIIKRTMEEAIAWIYKNYKRIRPEKVEIDDDIDDEIDAGTLPF